MIGLLLDWLNGRACDYLSWYDERERATYLPCPDCGGRGEDECICDEKAERDSQLQDAFDAGVERGEQRPWC